MGDRFPKISPSHGGSVPNLNHNSLGESHRTVQTAQRSAQPFLHSDRKVSLYFAMDRPFPPKLSLPMRDRESRLTHDSLGPSQPTSQTEFRSVSRFAQMTAECPYTLQWDAPFFPHNCPLPIGGSGPHLIHSSLGLPESATKPASRSVQPFCRAH